MVAPAAAQEGTVMICHAQDLADDEVEELAEELWTLLEDGRDALADLVAISKVAAAEEVVDRMSERGLAQLLPGARVALTEAGRHLAQRQVRRHRLTEVLFTTVLEVPDDAAVNRTACVIEHVLDAAMTDSVCAFLGHPQRCPHGKAIPPGACCRSFSRPVEPLVQPLSKLAPGAAGRIVHIVPREAGRLMRLASLGLVPGARLRLQQIWPAVVVRIGETTLALESDVAGEIFVKRQE
jgi:DtxR family transcriptional regulator, Mn-dependent transcriptional regulator